RDLDRRTPEFSDVMEHMVINPTWNVPRSIAVKEYLPLLQQNPNAAGHMRLVNGRGQVVSREGLDFTQFNERTFPFDIKQPPSRRNALGLVKFMFPNRHNIYLHDTPAKKLFGRETRAFSHGCVRLADPFDFAYALLAKQEKNPEAYFQSVLATRKERVVPLEQQVPVHLVYRTAFTQAKGNVQFRRDVYGRDAKIWRALEQAGVSLGSVRG
ncbi:MAG: L,D-transpeptidase family protein, partial [Silicimonas sp.]|nr:L,D-transpeptidase family protein [Silicimonas sp.]